MFEARYATREDIDAAMRLGCGLPMGPLALLDLIGLDTAYEILDTMYKQGRDRLHAPAPILKQMVTAGLRGRKSGRGFYTYEEPTSPVVVPDALTPGAARERPADAHRRAGRRRGLGDDGDRHHRGVRQGRLRRAVRDPRRREGRGRAQRRCSARWTRRCCAASSPSADRDAALARITGSTRFDDLADRDLVIEAVVEELSVKTALFETFDEICKPGTILATTTSSLPVVELAAATRRPADVVGLHFFNPAPVMELVEVVSTVATAAEVRRHRWSTLCERLGKHAGDAARDRAGFIVNALLFPYLNDAVKMLEVQYATEDDIDTAMKTGCGYPMGPFELLDVVGLDVAAGDPAHPLPGVPRAGVRTGPAARAPDDGGVPRAQDRPRLPLVRLGPRAWPAGTAASLRPDRAAARARACSGSRSTPTATGSCAGSAGRARRRAYRCPGCDQLVAPGTPHVVAWPADGAGRRVAPAALAHPVLGGPGPAAPAELTLYLRSRLAACAARFTGVRTRLPAPPRRVVVRTAVKPWRACRRR